jgi:Mg2+/citrate symporter
MAGLAVTWWWLGRRGMGTGARAALVGVATVFLTPFAAAAWVTIGLADVWLGFREREQTS